MADRENDESNREHAEGLDDQSEQQQQRAKHLQAERLLAEQLIGGDMGSAETKAKAEAEAVRRLPPRWEIRIQTEQDPVEEETKKYRSMAQEVDDRYDGNKK